MGRFFGGIVDSAILYARHLGWLASTPEKSKSSRWDIHKDSAYGKAEAPQESAVLIEMAIECGLKSSTGFGAEVITWSEIRSWMDSVGETNTWIPSIIKKISEAYISELRQGVDPARPCPISDLVDLEEKRKMVKSQFKNFIASRS